MDAAQVLLVQVQVLLVLVRVQVLLVQVQVQVLVVLVHRLQVRSQPRQHQAETTSRRRSEGGCRGS